MAPIVAPGICRYSVNQTLGGQQVVNILDMGVISNDPLVDREDHINRVAGDILNNWTDHILPFQCDDLVAQSVSWLDLNSLDGSRGERTSTDENTWPEAGGNDTEPVMPGVVAMRVDKATSGTRGSKNGRMYLSGMSEPRSDAGSALSWLPATITQINGYLDDFLEGINNASGPDLFERSLRVIHTREGQYNGDSAVTSLRVNALISTQVRRGGLR